MAFSSFAILAARVVIALLFVQEVIARSSGCLAPNISDFRRRLKDGNSKNKGYLRNLGEESGGKGRKKRGKKGSDDEEEIEDCVYLFDGETYNDQYATILPLLCDFPVKITEECSSAANTNSGAVQNEDVYTEWYFTSGSKTEVVNMNTGKTWQAPIRPLSRTFSFSLFTFPLVDQTYIGGSFWDIWPGELGTGQVPDGPALLYSEGYWVQSINIETEEYSTTVADVQTIDVCKMLATTYY